MDYVIVGLFAFLGSNVRYYLGMWLPKLGVFPIGTLVVNLIGCFLFTWLVKHILVDQKINGRLILGIGTGFFGAFTTFSSFAIDSVNLMRGNDWLLAVVYLVCSICGGLLMAFLGDKLGGMSRD
ncbi:fluoride efflux transporter CrcB [Enterococcus mediterraneensis]|uniref:fluoride efflux transporter CrcB n=1 Tax=Enterococcus mediterraneensis TaxID=2364791 RepID=UPI000F04E5E8|nr:fluoride efflux transporter CrcB [Enterococcus mediterraneensis]